MAPRCHAGFATQTDLMRKEVLMKRPNLEMRAMDAKRENYPLIEAREAMRLRDQCQCAGADSALLSGDSGCC